ncbi:MAG: ATP-binding protein [Elainellaceae cyanobacterium]
MPAESSASLDASRLVNQTASLLLYPDTLNNPVGRAWCHLLNQTARRVPTLEVLQAYSQCFAALAASGHSWHSHLITQILYADNPFTQAAQRQQINGGLKAAAAHDLDILQQIYQEGDRLGQEIKLDVVRGTIPLSALEDDALPQFPLATRLSQTAETPDHWSTLISDIADHHRQHGVGQFARYRAFTWQQGQLTGITTPDPITLDNLTGYSHPRQQLLRNTEALLSGYPALNVLLYGSRGSGKSSLVKALLNEYGDRGLRLIEVPKDELRQLPQIVEQIRHLPQRFILFVDDLSFEEDDEAFKALKVVLEGGVIARPANVVVYATSNRRHLIREFHEDRPRPKDAGEIHQWDTVQEKLSFSDRFGLTLTFEPADQTAYLDIVRHLARQAQLDIAAEDLERKALQWATRHNGRSGRTARQFVDALTAAQHLQPDLEEPDVL